MDSLVVAVIALSGVVAFARGFVREILGIGAWVGAFFFASVTVDAVRPWFHTWIGNADIADPAAYAAMFLAGLIVLSILTGMVGSAVRTSVLGGVDRTLGLVFGVLRGVVLVAAVYIASGWVITSDRWPEAVQHSHTVPIAYGVAKWIVQFLPPDYRPNIPVPPLAPVTKAADLLQAIPQGRAIARP
jgi:membrane protein required for colicin V production